MDIKPNGPEHKRERDRLPNRRACETSSFKHAGADFTLSVGRYPDGKIGELFIAVGLPNSALDALASDAAILASLALQHGCPLETITHALRRNSQGEAASPIGAALDRIQP